MLLFKKKLRNLAVLEAILLVKPLLKPGLREKRH
jgi:hypothetical protein